MVIHKQKDKRIKWILSFLIFLLIFMGTYVRMVSLIAFVVFAYVLVFCDSKDVAFVIMFTMAFANIFKMSPTSQSMFTYIILGYVVYELIIGGRGCSNEFWVAFVGLICFLLLQSLISSNLLRAIKFVANFLFLYFAMYDTVGNERDVFLAYIIGMILASAIAWLNLVPHLDLYRVSTVVLTEEGSANRFSGLYPDPNPYSINIIIALCLAVILHYKKQIKLVSFILICLALLTGAILTYSKSALLMLVIPVLMFLYTNQKFGRYGVQITCVVGFILIVIYALMGKVDFLATVMDRLKGANNLSELTTGRSKIWGNYIANFLQEPIYILIGRGIDAPLVKGKGSHNTYIETIYYLGIIGTFFVTRMIYIITKDFQTLQVGKNFLNYSVTIVVLVMYFFLGQLFQFDLPFHALIAILVFNMRFSNGIQ